ncbi:MAG TPA: hypothetical protein VHC91_15730 [Trinickia sp.]|nr:hypothetical protein [Trinickia sp.]HVW51817.1 hypothetical protein [Trinickia sp.]
MPTLTLPTGGAQPDGWADATGGKISPELKGIQGDTVALQPDLEMELVGFPNVVDHADGVKPDILEMSRANVRVGQFYLSATGV